MNKNSLLNIVDHRYHRTRYFSISSRALDRPIPATDGIFELTHHPAASGIGHSRALPRSMTSKFGNDVGDSARFGPSGLRPVLC